MEMAVTPKFTAASRCAQHFWQRRALWTPQCGLSSEGKNDPLLSPKGVQLFPWEPWVCIEEQGAAITHPGSTQEAQNGGGGGGQERTTSTGSGLCVVGMEPQLEANSTLLPSETLPEWP